MPRRGKLWEILDKLQGLAPRMKGWALVRRGDGQKFWGLFIAVFSIGPIPSKHKTYHLFILDQIPAVKGEDLLFGLVEDSKIKTAGNPFRRMTYSYGAEDMRVFSLEGLYDELQPHSAYVRQGLGRFLRREIKAMKEQESVLNFIEQQCR